MRAAPRVFQGHPPSQSSSLCHHSPPPRRPRRYASSRPCPSDGPPARLSCAGTGSREEEKKGRKKEGREGRREGVDTTPTSHRRSPQSTELEELHFLTLTQLTAQLA